ncbi:MAG: o-succinylbenzoate synthase [Leptolyngbya sp. RL_3_1]|nr:o-succinylbenzoate synthase [Leptolyngbya sp. RL_3_1]
MPSLHLSVRRYRRPFRQPLLTHHGPWAERTGLILRVVSTEGGVGFGEVAPIPWFGTETLEAALAYCQHLDVHPTYTALQNTPDTLPACQFGLHSALAQLQHPPRRVEPFPLQPEHICALLPTGAAALNVWQPLWAAGHRTFKWKIGLASPAQEQADLAKLVAALPQSAKLRLDANGGLTVAEADAWLQHCAALGRKIAFLEQPLSPAQWPELQRLGDRYGPLVALDESVATVTQLAQTWAAGWPGTVVIKPAIAGHPQRLQALCRQYAFPAVFSSALCTMIGRQAALAMATRLDPNHQQALGFGVNQWFQDDWETLSAAELWDQLPP